MTLRRLSSAKKLSIFIVFRTDFCGIRVGRLQALDDRDETRVASDWIHHRHHHGPIGMTAELTGETFETTDGEFALAQQHEHDRNLVTWERVAARWVQITVRGKGGITKSKRVPIAATRQRF